MAIADRYGGVGIGRNGGSGRNAILHGLQIKGIGRTPLVSPSTEISHASGGAYLEECVREAIYAQVVAHDFPYGAVPAQAIIDTGLEQDWPAPIQPARERRVLLVRPLFVRPAHFERALGFDSGVPFEGERDHLRVKAVIGAASEAIGKAELLGLFESFWFKWAHQIAYGFVHRLPHGNNTSSNISLDGRLVDFGATSAVPNWHNTASSYLHDPFRTRFECIARTIRSVYYYLGRHLDPALSDRSALERLIERCREAFRRFTVLEVLRSCGVEDRVAVACMRGSRLELGWHAAYEAIDHHQQTNADLLEPGQYPDNAWDLRKIWSHNPARHLRALSALVKSLVAAAEVDEARQRCQRLSATRTALFKPNLRARFFDEIREGDIHNLGADPDFVRNFIDSNVAASLRESTVRRGSKEVRLAMDAALR
jgi:hypothetical protein